MSQKYPGGIISKTAPVPTGPYENGTAPGVWTLEQQAEFVKQGIWPIAGNVPNYIEDVFSTWLYTGNGSTQTITNGIDLAGEGGLLWIKNRTSAVLHQLYTTNLGSDGYLRSNGTEAFFSTVPDPITYNANGFSLNTSSSGNNANSANYVSWTFREQPKFFDVVTFTTGTSLSTNRRISHSLGSVPGCILVKRTTGAQSWLVYHRSTGRNAYLLLDTTEASTSFTNAWGTSDPTSTDFGINEDSLCFPSSTYVAYVFAHNAGGFGLTGTDNVISCGSFTGPSSGGLDVNLGYEPQWILTKKVSGAENWNVWDNMRGWSLTQQAQLYPNLSSAEYVFSGTDYFYPTATGFRLNSSFGLTGDYIYIAIRRGPMKVPTTGTSVFAPYTATLSAGTTVNAGLTPDLLFAKFRPGQDNPRWVDRLRGFANATGGSNPELYSNETSPEATSTAWSFNWNNTGYIIGNALNGLNCVLYAFRRAPNVFDEVCYTGTGSAGVQIPHNLGAPPELLIVKPRNQDGSWRCYAAPLGATKYITLNETDAAATLSGFWNDTAPTSTVFTLGSSNLNNSGIPCAAYLFASCPGVSKVGSFTGTGATQVINCGFTAGARYVLIKATSTTGDWLVWDSARGIVAGNDPYLRLNSNAAEVTNTDWVDTASTGFELSNAGGNLANSSGVSYIFLAIA